MVKLLYLHSRSVFWYHSTRILFIPTIQLSYNATWLTKLFHQFRKFSTLNVVVIFNDLNSGSIQKFTYNQFKEIELENITMENEIEKLYYNKIKNLYGYPLRLSQHNEPIRSFINNETVTTVTGIDGMAFTEMCKVLNATYRLVFLKTHSEGHEFYQIAQDLVLDQADVNFNMRLVLSRNYLDQSIEPIYPLDIDSLVFIVPKGKRKERTLFDPFKSDTWISWILSSGVFLLLWKFIMRRDTSTDQLIVYILLIFSNNSMFKRIVTFVEKTFVIGFILCSFLMFSFYQSVLPSTIMKSNYHRDLNTIVDLNKSGLTFRIHNGTVRVLNYCRLYNIPISNKIIVANTYPLFDIKENPTLKNKGIISYSVVADIFEKSFANQLNGRKIMHIVKEGFLFSPSGYHVRKRSIYREEMGRIITIFREAGLYQRFRGVGYYEALKRKIITLNDIDPQLKSVPLNIHSFITIVMVLLLGQIGSVIIFCVELLIYRIENNSTNRIILLQGNSPTEL